MHKILIRQALLNGGPTDLLIEENRFTRIAPAIEPDGAEVIDASGMAIMPPFYNMHTHAAMSLLRGYADDMELYTWLNEHIWPAENRLDGADIYAGTRLAILEMIRSGTVFFNDMYWYQADAIRAVEGMGVRAAIGLLYISGEEDVRERNAAFNRYLLENRDRFGSRITLTHAPHAIYTVPEAVLREVAATAAQDGRPIHIHAAETAREVEECRAAHGGLTPVAYLDAVGLLGPSTILAHAVHLTDADIAIIRERGAVIAHCPCSNYKLASGRFPYRRAVEQGGCRFTLGTDGCASNNSLSMLNEMKFAALSAKLDAMDPAAAPDTAILTAATQSGAEAMRIDAGVIAEGKLADALLIDLHAAPLTPGYHLEADLVYAADPGCIDTVICDGKILMRGHSIPGEQEIIAEAHNRAQKFRRS